MTPADPARSLSLRFGVGTLKHLGGQMYGGGIVKPVAELIANAWDGEATRVEVTLPAVGAWHVEVADNGHGMTFQEVKDRYLIIGTDRRVVLGTDLTRSGQRKVMGRKGLGKLAVIQATGTVEIDTVAEASPDRFWRTKFRIPYGDFLALPGSGLEEDRPVEILFDGEAPEESLFPDGSSTGTRTKLLDVRLANRPNLNEFIQSMHTRFALAAETDTFSIVVDKAPVPRIEEAVEALNLEFKWEGADEVADVGPVKWWVGFTPNTQPRDELQGMAVYARKRLAVERPFFFNLTRGFTGQLAKEYMTGAVYVDAIDEVEDLIATDRGTINWDHPIGHALQVWGQALVRKHAKLWEEQRGERMLEALSPDPRLMDLISKLGTRQRQDCELVLRSLARQPHATKVDLDRTATVLLNGQQHQEFLETLSELTSTNIDELPGILAKWNVLEALLYLPVIRSRIEVIDKLKRLIEDAAPEFPDIFEHLRSTPELLRPEWEPLSWNQWMSTIVDEVFNEDIRDDPDAQKRPDVICLADSRNFVVVELKRPGHRVSNTEAMRMLKYMRLIQDQVSHASETKGSTVVGVLVCDDLDDDARYNLSNMGAVVEIRPWRAFLADAERAHRFILERIKERVPAEDPRAAAYLEEVLHVPPQAALTEGPAPEAEDPVAVGPE